MDFPHDKTLLQVSFRKMQCPLVRDYYIHWQRRGRRDPAGR